MNKTARIILMAMLVFLACGKRALAGMSWQTMVATSEDLKRSGQVAQAFNGALYVIGGGNGSPKNDVWRSENGINWTRIVEHAAFPPLFRRKSFVFANEMWIVGGHDWFTSPYLWPDVWHSSDGISWISANSTWTPVPGGVPFEGRTGHTAVVHNGAIWLIGGVGPDGANYKSFNDVWKSTNGINWTQVALNPASPIFSARSAHASVSYGGRLWVLGGTESQGQNPQDVWSTVDGTTWTQHPNFGTDNLSLELSAFDWGGKLWLTETFANGPKKVRTYSSAEGWSVIPGLTLNLVNQWHSAAIFKDRLWAIGGTTNGEVLATYETRHLTINAVNGSVMPDNTEYPLNSVVTLTATPNPGFTFTGWSDDASGANNTTTITMDRDKTVTANFTELPKTITVRVLGKGVVVPTGRSAILPDGNAHSVPADHGSSITFNLITGIKFIAEGYEVKKFQFGNDLLPGILLDGVPVPVDNPSSPDYSKIYTLANIVANHDIVVEYVRRNVPVTVTVTGSGSVTPSGVVQVPYGSGKSFGILPDDGYKLKEVIVNEGVPCGSGVPCEKRYTSVENNVFTLSKVKEPTTLHVVFEACVSASLAPNYVTVKVFDSPNDPTPIVKHVVPSGFGGVAQSQLQVDNTKSLVTGKYVNCRDMVTREAKPFVQHQGGFHFVPMDCGGLMKSAGEYFDGSEPGRPDASIPGFPKRYAYSENLYRDDPTFRLTATGFPGTAYSLDPANGHHSKSWRFGAASASSFLPPAELSEAQLDARAESSGPYFLTVTMDPNGAFTQAISDQLGNTVGVRRSPDGSPMITGYVYDLQGNILEETPPLGAAYKNTYAYSSREEVLSEKTPDKGVVEYRYDINGRLRFLRDARHQARDGNSTIKNRFRIFEYDALDRLTAIRETEGGNNFEAPDAPIAGTTKLKVEYVYDEISAGKLMALGISAPAAAINRVLSEAKFKTGKLAAAIAYDETGTRATADVFSYQNRELVSARYHFSSASIPVQKIAYAYGVDDKRVSMEYSNGIEGNDWAHGAWNNEDLQTYEYDALGRLEKIKQDGTNLVTYQYHERGLSTGERYFANTSPLSTDGMDFKYNIRDWATELSSTRLVPSFKQSVDYAGRFDGSATGSSLDYQFNASQGKSLDLVYGYDGVDRLTSVLTSDADMHSLYAYDGLGRLTRKKEGDIDYQHYDYEENSSRLNSVGVVAPDPGAQKAFVYDPNGNLVLDRSKKMVIDYDWQNMPYKIHIYDDIPNQALSWTDVENNKLVTQYGRTEVTKFEFLYDASGTRVLKDITVSGQRSITAYLDNYAVFEGATPTSLALTGLNFITPSGVKGRRDLQLGEKFFYLTDRLGSVTEVINDDGQLTHASAYQVYGMPHGLFTPSNGTRERHTGKELDEEGSANLYYYGARYYNPDIGSWTSGDPIDEYFNSYSFLGGDPMNYIDPEGLVSANAGMNQDIQPGPGGKTFDLDNIDIKGVGPPHEVMPQDILVGRPNGPSDEPSSSKDKDINVSPDYWDLFGGVAGAAQETIGGLGKKIETNAEAMKAKNAADVAARNNSRARRGLKNLPKVAAKTEAMQKVALRAAKIAYVLKFAGPAGDVLEGVVQFIESDTHSKRVFFRVVIITTVKTGGGIAGGAVGTAVTSPSIAGAVVGGGVGGYIGGKVGEYMGEGIADYFLPLPAK